MKPPTTAALLATATLLITLSAARSAPAQVTRYDEDKRMDMEAHADQYTGHARNGEGHYRRYCIKCHGDLGDGNGDSAPWVEPFKPRNFTLGIFKCRSTPTGTLPLDDDLFQTLHRGLNTSAMPHWSALTSQFRIDLVAYVKHFSPRFANEKPGTPVVIPAEPEVTPDRVKQGQQIYSRVQCWKCHGVTGGGNGPSAPTLVDDQNNPDPPFDFQASNRFKCGSTDSDFYKILMTGLDGSPMPSWSDNLKPEEAWDVIFYVRTFQPMKSKEKDIAKQLKLAPLNPDGSMPAGQH